MTTVFRSWVPVALLYMVLGIYAGFSLGRAYEASRQHPAVNRQRAVEVAAVLNARRPWMMDTAPYGVKAKVGHVFEDERPPGPDHLVVYDGGLVWTLDYDRWTSRAMTPSERSLPQP